MDDDKLAEAICAQVIRQYGNFKPSSKPARRSNGSHEWTVLAGVVLVDRQTAECRLVSAATGVKALPDKELERSHGRMVHDSHAEILALRGFNAVLLQQAKLVTDGRSAECDLVEQAKTQDRFRLASRWQAALYISKAPCGDCSMDMADDDADEMTFSPDDPIQYVAEHNYTMLRGRFNYSRKGVARTKPGRADSQITLSKSCSDKLASKTVMSLLSSMTWELFEEPVFLDYLVLPHTIATAGFERCFAERLAGLEGTHMPRLLCCHTAFPGDRAAPQQPPALTASVYLNITAKKHVEQALLNGVRNGAYVRPPRALAAHAETIVSRAALWRVFMQLHQAPPLSYAAFKRQQHARNRLKRHVRHRLSPDGWPTTRVDDCIASLAAT
ncbi:AFR267Wp [Eremothecium gossypii ATCC 10895]|uniref:AFR267Wp n=1 Tax=Eremothecium gossypii (strain ATCC 10895 / CBS 109.51 / FGSC 9923 / NRRL Y-1056) TaxID=284811 RepID=Q753P5_EREGS|nr:AFR267Wp [Eremothecium gossypii ATCC 10895]AAS53638.1 AFR267Wp [Eremothecium gossypii ATCC 10895]AEY97951.1 FAFR267Wp [Eremothecium gossypii FDAG1]